MGEAAHKEPSMEEILASIRRIVSEDEPAPSREGRSEPSASAPARPTGVRWGGPDREKDKPDNQIRPRTGETSLSDVVSDVRQSGQTRQYVGASKPQSVPPAARQPVGGSPAARPQPPQSGMHAKPVHPVSPSSASPSSSSGPRPGGAQGAVRPMQPAADRPSSVASEREVEAFRGALTSPATEAATRDSLDRLKRSAMGDVDAKVESILRPMLREWLDDNLPRLVEKLVRAEIERLARKG